MIASRGVLPTCAVPPSSPRDPARLRDHVALDASSKIFCSFFDCQKVVEGARVGC